MMSVDVAGPPTAFSVHARSIAQWLLGSSIQLRDGEDRGGVAGWLTAGSRPEFVYMEITGYYLTCLAFLARWSPELRPAATERAAMALGWLRRHTTEGRLPPTRKYLGSEPVTDWRNAAVFSFDIGMVVRGLLAAADLTGEAAGADLLHLYSCRLLAFGGADGTLRSHVPIDGSALANHLPNTWSTKPGGYHLKAVAAIGLLPAGLRSPELVQLSRLTFARWRDCTARCSAAADLHPMLYYLEGLLDFALRAGDARILSDIEAQWMHMLGLQAPDGSLRSKFGGPSADVRSDVVAQALRLGTLLRQLGYLPGSEWAHRLGSLAAALATFIGADGAVAFRSPSRAMAAPTQWNAWCAMFAYQALTLYAELGRCPSASEAAIQQTLRLLV